MNSNNGIPDDYENDEQLRAAADVTWTAMDSGDQLGHAIKELVQADLPESNPELPALLAKRLKAVEPAPRFAGESSVNHAGKESKVSPKSHREDQYRNSWLRWSLVLTTICFLPLAAAWWMFQHRLNPRPMFRVNDHVVERSPAEHFAENDIFEYDIFEAPAEWSGNIDEFPEVTEPRSFDSLGDSNSSGLTTIRPAHTKGYIEGDTDFSTATEMLESLQATELGIEGENSESGDAGGWTFYTPIDEGKSGEVYNQIYENQFLRTRGEQAISTFSIDVDTASYANMRRFLTNAQRPPRNSVRIEELINYFNYDYPQPEGDVPFSVNMEVASCPWNLEHQLIRVGLKGKDIHRDERPVSNLVFLLDVSGSMNSADKLPLVKRGLQMMIDRLNENDRVSIVTYAGNAGVVLEPTSGDQKKKIKEAIGRLGAGGSTHGSAGIEKAYNLAMQNFVEDGVNRVLWATDGDLNVGITDDQTLVNLVSERAKEGVFLTTLGFGTGNLKDGKLEQIANNGNGIYAYIDSAREAHKVLVKQMSASLVTIAKDVKLQIEFNPAKVVAYRLIGYENRMLKTEDFDNDAKDAGEIGAGHTVTAIYEVVPTDSASHAASPKKTPSLKYQQSVNEDEKEQADDSQEPAETTLSEAAESNELLTLALRYKQPDEDESTRIEFVLQDSDRNFEEASVDFRFAASVAGFGMILRGSKFRGKVTTTMVESIASGALGEDDDGYRAEFLDLVRRVK